jgi:hypothetical protein
MLLTAYRAAELRVNMLKDDIKMDIKELALKIALPENNLMKHNHNITIIRYNIAIKRRISCPVDLVLVVRPAHALCGTACLCSVMQPSQHTAVPKILHCF